LGPAEGEGDPFASYILNSATNRIVTRSIFLEHCDGPTPLDNFTKKYATLHSQFGIYPDEALTHPIPDVGEDHIPTTKDESCSFAVDTRNLSAQPNCIDLTRDDGVVNVSTSLIDRHIPNEGGLRCMSITILSFYTFGFFQLIRFMIRFTYEYMSQREYCLGTIRLFNDALYEVALKHGDSNGIRLYLCDVALDEFQNDWLINSKNMPLQTNNLLLSYLNLQAMNSHLTRDEKE